jgi:hypothetical protein
MGLRFAAVLTAAVMAVAAIAAFLATHHSPVGSVPAGQDRNVIAYEAMVTRDYATMDRATSNNNCATIQDQGCPAAIQRVIPTLQQWVGDLDTAKTPAGLQALDGQLRAHLTAVASDLTNAAAFQRANNSSGFDQAMAAGLYERAWIDPAALTLEGSYPRLAGSFHDEISLVRRSLSACVNSTPSPADLGCSRLSTGTVCTAARAQACEGDVQSAATEIEGFLIGLAQNPPPTALAGKDAQLQRDLAQADSFLLAITGDLMKGDTLQASLDDSSFAITVNTSGGDASAIPTG